MTVAKADGTGPARRRQWAFGDFAICGGRVVLRKTGNSAAIDGALVAEVAGWLLFQAAVRARGRLRRLRHGPGAAIWYAPDRPHPRYLLRAAATWNGMRVAARPDEADAAFFFEDATRSAPAEPPGIPGFNYHCTDIGKSRVADVFADVFGYKLALDPRRHDGPAVEKSETNGTHDGRIVGCPREPRPGCSYGRLIDTVDADGFAVDLRTHCVGRLPVLVTVKRRHPDRRFLPANVSANIAAPHDVFSHAELGRIGAFLDRMGADWCGLDILRDRDGRIYIVDVNKTDAGPITALSLSDKIRSTAVMARALERMIGEAQA